MNRAQFSPGRLYQKSFGYKPYDRIPSNSIGASDEGGGVSENNRFAYRLALLSGVDFSPTDLEIITSEIEDMNRILTELEKFAHDTPWVFVAGPADEKKFG
jgi:hypothetical protein